MHGRTKISCTDVERGLIASGPAGDPVPRPAPIATSSSKFISSPFFSADPPALMSTFLPASEPCNYCYETRCPAKLVARLGLEHAVARRAGKSGGASLNRC